MWRSNVPLDTRVTLGGIIVLVSFLIFFIGSLIIFIIPSVPSSKTNNGGASLPLWEFVLWLLSSGLGALLVRYICEKIAGRKL